jgi:hypothetical protein
MANRGVLGRIVYAGMPNAGIDGLKVAAFDIDNAPDEEYLGETSTDPYGNFANNFTPEQYR